MIFSVAVYKKIQGFVVFLLLATVCIHGITAAASTVISNVASHKHLQFRLRPLANITYDPRIVTFIEDVVNSCILDNPVSQSVISVLKEENTYLAVFNEYFLDLFSTEIQKHFHGEEKEIEDIFIEKNSSDLSSLTKPELPFSTSFSVLVCDIMRNRIKDDRYDIHLQRISYVSQQLVEMNAVHKKRKATQLEYNKEIQQLGLNIQSVKDLNGYDELLQKHGALTKALENPISNPVILEQTKKEFIKVNEQLLHLDSQLKSMNNRLQELYLLNTQQVASTFFTAESNRSTENTEFSLLTDELVIQLISLVKQCNSVPTIPEPSAINQMPSIEVHSNKKPASALNSAKNKNLSFKNRNSLFNLIFLGIPSTILIYIIVNILLNERTKAGVEK